MDETQQPTSQPLGAPQTVNPMQPAPVATAPQPKNKKTKLIAIIVVAVLLLLGGSAAAYFGAVVPNKPENLLKSAVKNLAEQESFTGKGYIDVASQSGALRVDVNMLHTDMTTNTSLADIEVAFSGIKVPAEIRYVGDSVYIKLGDLSSLVSAAAGFGLGDVPELATLVETKLSNQWIEIDRTLLNQATAESQSKCSPEEVAKLTRSAVNEVLELAVDDQASPYTILNTTKEDVDGSKATKIELGLDNARLVEFGGKARDLSAIKELEKCDDQSNTLTEGIDPTAGDANVTVFNVWIDGSKNFKRIEINTETDDNSGKVTSKLDLTALKDAPTVEKPSDAKPVIQLIGELQSQFGGSSTGGLESLGGSLSL